MLFSPQSHQTSISFTTAQNVRHQLTVGDKFRSRVAFRPTV